MLPGFRFLFAAIVLSVSLLVFGLGAAALLRAAHEQFASLPQMRASGAQFARQNDSPTPMLTLLRVDPAPLEPQALEQHANITMPVALPVTEPEAAAEVAATPAIAGPDIAKPLPTAPEPEKFATLTTTDRDAKAPGRAEPPKSDAAASETKTPAAPALESNPPAVADKVATLTPALTALGEPALAATPANAIGEPAGDAALGEPLIVPELSPPPPRPKPVALRHRAHVARVAEPAPRRRHIRRAPPAKPPAATGPFGFN
jgi:hypothetical protein